MSTPPKPPRKPRVKRYPKPAQNETEHTIEVCIRVPVFGRPGDKHDLKAAAAVMEAVKLSVDSRCEGVILVERQLGDTSAIDLAPKPHRKPIPSMAELIGKDVI